MLGGRGEFFFIVVSPFYGIIDIFNTYFVVLILFLPKTEEQKLKLHAENLFNIFL